MKRERSVGVGEMQDIYFFSNRDICHNNVFEKLKFGKQIDIVHLEGTMSQILCI